MGTFLKGGQKEQKQMLRALLQMPSSLRTIIGPRHLSVTQPTCNKDALCLRTSFLAMSLPFLYSPLTYFQALISHVSELWSVSVRSYFYLEWSRGTKSMHRKLYISLQNPKMRDSLFPQRAPPDCEIKPFYLGISFANFCLKKTITNYYPRI